MGFILFSKIGMFAYNHKRKKKHIILPDIYSDTLDTDISVDVPLRPVALFGTLTLDIPVRPMDAKGLSIQVSMLKFILLLK